MATNKETALSMSQDDIDNHIKESLSNSVANDYYIDKEDHAGTISELGRYDAYCEWFTYEQMLPGVLAWHKENPQQ